MRLPPSELECRAAAQSRRQENGGDETSYSEDGGPGNQPNAGSTIVLPLIVGVCIFILLFGLLLGWVKVWRGRQETTSTGEASIERMRRRPTNKSSVASVQLLGSLTIARFEAINQKVGLAEDLPDPTGWNDIGLQTIGNGAAANRTQDDTSRIDVDSQTPQRIELGRVNKSVTNNPRILPSKPRDIATRLQIVGCTICEEDFQVGQDVRLLPCKHGYHPACIDPWLLNMSATCPLCRNSISSTPPKCPALNDEAESANTPVETAVHCGFIEPVSTSAPCSNLSTELETSRECRSEE